ncbi:hypothetical protein [Endozoicomonas sp.]|uniref:hypothetical protein n=1 Tax=Endozoicomonas sp. TaxID=1892382 RepID=UPI002886CBE9|nr:hypothetical protein [Endozoicomonas sp.]
MAPLSGVMWRPERRAVENPLIISYSEWIEEKLASALGDNGTGLSVLQSFLF